jgi:hypothetical protein
MGRAYSCRPPPAVAYVPKSDKVKRRNGRRRRVDRVEGSDVYRTESGMIFRVSEDPDGHLSVGILEGSRWVEARIGVVGLRRSPTTVRLTQKQILRLPA